MSVHHSGSSADAVAKTAGDNGTVTLDIIVEGVGRVNTGVDYDFKGLTSKLVLLNGALWQRSARKPPCGSACMQPHPKSHMCCAVWHGALL